MYGSNDKIPFQCTVQKYAINNPLEVEYFGFLLLPLYSVTVLLLVKMMESKIPLLIIEFDHAIENSIEISYHVQTGLSIYHEKLNLTSVKHHLF